MTFDLLNWSGLKHSVVEMGISAIARGPESPDWEYRLREAIKCAQTFDIDVKGDGGAAAFVLSQLLVRRWAMPLQVAYDLFVEHANPRIVNDNHGPWVDGYLVRKLEQARDIGGFEEARPEEMSDLAAVAREACRKPGTAPKTDRRSPRLEHRYTFMPGDQPNGEKEELSLGKVVAKLVSHPDWIGVLQYDEFLDKIKAVNPPMQLDAERDTLSDEDALAIQVWFEVQSDYLITKEKAFQGAVLASRKLAYHPIREYLQALPSGDISLLDDLATRLLGAEHLLENDFLRKFLIASVRRILRPGCKVDTMLILMGLQGHKKSTFAKDLFGASWMAEDISLELKSKDALEALQGVWCIEMAEVDKQLRTDTSTVKAFLSRTADRYRASYARATLTRPRQCVFLGTTNEDTLLRDSTGDRRFWVIRTQKKADLDWLRTNRDAIWSAAVSLEATGAPHWYDNEAPLEAIREQYIEKDTWHESIRDYCCGKEHVRGQQIFLDLFKGQHGGIEKYGRREELRICGSLKRLGCHNGVLTTGEKKVKVWFVPEKLTAEEPSQEEKNRRGRIYNP